MATFSLPETASNEAHGVFLRVEKFVVNLHLQIFADKR